MPTPRQLDEAIGLIDSEVDALAEGSTWLLRAWLQDGVVLEPTQIGELAARLGDLGSPSARLHVAQAIDQLSVPADQADRFARFLRAGLDSDHPFLRAWSMSGLVALSRQHARFAGPAESALRDAFEDPAASVRARARRVSSGE